MSVGLCHGCFDILHPGHLNHLEAAKEQVDRLVVGITSDIWVTFHKGPGHPFVKQEDRARMLRALRCVDEVVIDDFPTPELLLWKLKPDIYFKGEDYKGSRRALLWGQEFLVKRYGGKMVIVGAKLYSSSSLAARERWPKPITPDPRMK